MKDMVPKGTGNSRFLRSSIPENITHEELVALLRAGTFPVDFAGLNTEGIATQGSAYNKANVLPDSVCSKLGIATSSEPKDAFTQLLNKITSTESNILSRIVTGTYIGNGETDEYTEQTISLGFKPKGVFVIQKSSGITSGGSLIYFAFAIPDSGAKNSNGGIYITSNGFIATWDGETNSNYYSAILNRSGRNYCYLAIK